MTQQKPLDLATVRAQLNSLRGKQFWQGLEELAGTEEFKEFLHREFPRQASVLGRSVDRRHFLKLMGASIMLAGLAGCSRQPDERVVPYVQAPPAELVPGKPLYFATAMTLAGYALGLLVENNQGRPTKVEGNPDHPASLGPTDSFAQASVLGLYDPDRAQAVTFQGQIRSYDQFGQALRGAIEGARATGGAGLRILTENVSSPTLAAQLNQILADFPQARWYQWEPAAPDNILAGSTLAFGEPVHTRYRFDAARVILALDADFLECTPATLRYVYDFAQRRKVRAPETEMNRLYAVESSPTLAGAKADHRLPMQARQVEGFARALAARLGVDVPAPESLPGVPDGWIDALARDLEQNSGAGIVIAGARQPATVHALAHAINDALGNTGNTVIHTAPILANPVDNHASLRELVDEMAAGQVSTLLIISGNPAYTAPSDIRFADAYANVGLRIHVSQHFDETSALSHWHVPEAHYLEAWGDARAFDGTVSIVQPLIQPLYGGRSAYEILALFGDQPQASGYDLVREYWQGQYEGDDFDSWWQGALHRGIVPDSALPEITPALDAGRIRQGLETAEQAPAEGLEIIFQPDPNIYDGRFANNAWLQELPKPLTTLTWDNAVLIAPATAARLNLAQGDIVELSYAGAAVRGPVYVLPGHAAESVTVHLGYGRNRAGRVGSDLGFNAYLLRTSTRPWFDSGLQITKTGDSHRLAAVQFHWRMEGRDLVQAGTLQQFQENPNFVEPHKPEISLYPEYPYEGYRWGMVIDQTACIGCNACVVACQSENNIPVVGYEEVLVEREMHWLRVDRYYTGDMDNPDTYFQPVPCMHCEKAPCEVVCPVNATVHSDDGLNDMVYNRCVGTRYCSNNCPYKVRRFNYLDYTLDENMPVIELARNPRVTVRSRGVMEKCTYCVQRIRAAEPEAEKEGRRIRDGEVITACAAACPAQAIYFGDLNDEGSQVAQVSNSPLNYALLGELNTRPRTTYLAALRNPNPEIEALAVAME